MKDFDSPLDPGCQGHQPDLKQDAKTLRPVLEALDRAIISLKDQLMFSRMSSGRCRTACWAWKPTSPTGSAGPAVPV